MTKPIPEPLQGLRTLITAPDWNVTYDTTSFWATLLSEHPFALQRPVSEEGRKYPLFLIENPEKDIDMGAKRFVSVVNTVISHTKVSYLRIISVVRGESFDGYDIYYEIGDPYQTWIAYAGVSGARDNKCHEQLGDVFSFLRSIYGLHIDRPIIEISQGVSGRAMLVTAWKDAQKAATLA